MATRTAAELWKAAGERKAAREKAEEERRRGQQARAAAAKAAAYARHLDDLAARQEAPAFSSRFRVLREQHRRKPGLHERFDKAGLPRLP